MTVPGLLAILLSSLGAVAIIDRLFLSLQCAGGSIYR
jgi:hypothetical protein